MTPQATPQLDPVHFLELEITGRCQLTCGHCYADSGPSDDHGTMTTGDWENLLISAPDAGIKTVQLDEQRAEEAYAQMKALGVNRLGPIDRMRGVGRGASIIQTGVTELCGQCGNGRAAVASNGDVWMCVMSRFLQPAGNVKTTPLAEILAGQIWQNLLTQVPRRGVRTCNPGSDGNDCAPAETICESNALIIPARRVRVVPLAEIDR
ncbi:SPASM domain-containing protein [Sphaerisporangium fuscum]|uniref:SPASM domain-containing protein n=1 Tax=Sphaerisporangium fuscum TaxID=2835868 RepID=UPI001BDBF94E|nr:SPASM domain-containing protein [Sphaerisporangium fuscum]